MEDDNNRPNVQNEAKRNEKLSKETLGKFFFDLAKIAFTGLVVGGIVSIATDKTKPEYWLIVAIGFLATYLFSAIGYKIIK